MKPGPFAAVLAALLAASLPGPSSAFDQKAVERLMAPRACQKCDLTGFTMPHSHNLTGALLQEARFTGATMPGVVLVRAQLRLAKFDKAKMPGAQLMNAQMSGADFYWADLTKANLSRAVLQDANLQIADLSGANLSGAVLIGANLQGARLEGTILTGANLSGAIWVDGQKRCAQESIGACN